MINLRDIIFEYSAFVLFVPLFLFFKDYQRQGITFRLLLLYLLLSSFTLITSFALWKLKRNNLPLLHIHTVLECLLLMWFYSTLLRNMFPAGLFWAVASIFLIFAIISSMCFESIYTFNTLSRSLEALIIIFFCLGWFVKIVSQNDEYRSNHNWVNYVNGGLLVYFSGSLVLFSYSNMIKELPETHRINIWFIHTLLLTQLYILITIGLWKARAR